MTVVLAAQVSVKKHTSLNAKWVPVTACQLHLGKVVTQQVGRASGFQRCALGRRELSAPFSLLCVFTTTAASCALKTSLPVPRAPR